MSAGDVQHARLWRSFYAAEAAREGREDPVFYMQEPPERECPICSGVLGTTRDCPCCGQWNNGAEPNGTPRPRGLTVEFLDRLYGPRQVQR